MKKTLIALAALAAVGTASAQSTVTLSGTVKGGVAQTKYSGGGVPGVSGLGVADGSSRFILSGSEDLGGGLRANFQIDNRFRVDDNGGAPTSNPVGTGATFVGLSGGFGNVQLGKLDTHYCQGIDSHSARATALTASNCAILGYVNVGGVNVAIAQQTRTTNALRYTTPNMSGFTAQVTYSTAQAGGEGALGDTGKGRAIAAALNYAAGPLRAGLSVWNSKQENRTAGAAIAVGGMNAASGDQSAVSVMGGYDFGMGTVALAYDRSTATFGTVGGVTADSRRTSWSVPVTFKLGTGTLLATYSRAGDVSGVANTGANLWSVGYDYPLSKRTSVGVSYVKLTNQTAASYQLYTQAALLGTANQVVGQDASQFYVGVRHTF